MQQTFQGVASSRTILWSLGELQFDLAAGLSRDVVPWSTSQRMVKCNGALKRDPGSRWRCLDFSSADGVMGRNTCDGPVVLCGFLRARDRCITLQRIIWYWGHRVDHENYEAFIVEGIIPMCSIRGWSLGFDLEYIGMLARRRSPKHTHFILYCKLGGSIIWPIEFSKSFVSTEGVISVLFYQNSIYNLHMLAPTVRLEVW